jgi:Na+/H+-translocating membrane pyrophosphatase
VLLVTLVSSYRQRAGVTVPQEARRVLVALERASATALKHRLIKLPGPLGATGVALVFAPLLFVQQPISTFSLSSAVTTFVLLLSGALVAFAMAWMTTLHVRAYAFSVYKGTQSTTSQALSSSWNASISLVVAAEVIGVLVPIALDSFLSIFGQNLPSIAQSGHTQAASASANLIAIFGLGAVITALWFQQMGTTCLGAAHLGANGAFARQTGCADGDPRNPAILVDTLAKQLGEVIPRVLDAFVTSCIVTTLTLLLLHHPAKNGVVFAGTGAATLPLLLRGFGLLACVFGLFTVRAAEHEPLERAISRSYWVVIVVFSSAIVGTITWVVGTWSTAVVIAALLGVGCPVLVAYLRSYSPFQKNHSKTTLEQPRAEIKYLSTDALGQAIRLVALAPIAVYAIVFMVGSHFLKQVGTDDSWYQVAVLVGLSVPSALSAWHSAPSLSQGIQATAVLSGALGRLPVSDDFTRRQNRLTTALDLLATRFDPIVTDGGILLCCLAAYALLSWSQNASPPLWVPGITAIVFAVALTTLVTLGDTLRHGAKSALTQVSEVERQLRGLRHQGQFTQVPDEFVPSYRSCVELVARDASRGGLLALTCTVLPPILTALVGTRSENSSGPQATLLAMYLSVAAATGLVVMHAGHAAPLASLLVNRHRKGRLLVGTDSEARSGSLELLDFLRRSIAVSVPLLTKATTLVALAIAAMLT